MKYCELKLNAIFVKR